MILCIETATSHCSAALGWGEELLASRSVSAPEGGHAAALAPMVEELLGQLKAEGKQLRPVPDDKPWSPSTVLGILRNPRYAGYSVYTSKDTRRQEAGESRRKALPSSRMRTGSSSSGSGRRSSKQINGGQFRTFSTTLPA